MFWRELLAFLISFEPSSSSSCFASGLFWRGQLLPSSDIMATPSDSLSIPPSCKLPPSFFSSASFSASVDECRRSSSSSSASFLGQSYFRNSNCGNWASLIRSHRSTFEQQKDVMGPYPNYSALSITERTSPDTPRRASSRATDDRPRWDVAGEVRCGGHLARRASSRAKSKIGLPFCETAAEDSAANFNHDRGRRCELFETKWASESEVYGRRREIRRAG